ncbi:hypothetical protein IMG5_001830 [Ichthyophthirius multifiliis]|uniref:Uncharacterized protein n=1 Tax=Ichthyophthirius multifiliis TaxID=5932 RepID=G0QJ13_ICHMU|nr:hypothetical protein IMG5_001830 [Ichthyophthirius multifiliis]EGR34806.1 hypothetical protein IMG5_001830 [Ichthyophthirius multifiliis]|eukprot:XP_004040110.1 hypothetical protein IMG5_001830 [Ichthyophthirius multifiliis]
MVKAYLRYTFENVCGLVSGHSSNIITNDNYIFSGNSQYVTITNSKTEEIVKILFDKDKNSEVTFLALSNSLNYQKILAVGYVDGDILIWNLEDYSIKCNLNAHKNNITCIQFNDDCSQLISGSDDTSIIVWDLLGEQALYKLTGHKNSITDLLYYKYRDNNTNQINEFILSTSKDGLFKIWDMAIASSVQTISSLSNQVWNMALYKEEKIILLGTNNDEVIVLKFITTQNSQTKQNKIVENIGIYKKQSFAHPTQMTFTNNNQYLFLLTNEKTH